MDKREISRLLENAKGRLATLKKRKNGSNEARELLFNPHAQGANEFLSTINAEIDAEEKNIFTLKKMRKHFKKK